MRLSLGNMIGSWKATLMVDRKCRLWLGLILLHADAKDSSYRTYHYKGRWVIEALARAPIIAL